MIRSIFYGGFRSLLKQKKATMINIVGLSLGIALFLYLLLFTQQELSVDKQHSKNIYRIENGEWALMGPGLAPAIKQDISGIENITRLDVFNYSNKLVSIGEKRVTIEKFIFTDASFFSMFNVKLLEGNLENLLKEPFSIVLTQKQAKILYGTEHALGKTFLVDSKFTYTVTGIMEDLGNSTISTDAIGRFSDIATINNNPQFETNVLGNCNHPTYIMIENRVDKKNVEQQINNWVKKRYPENSSAQFRLNQLQNIYFDTTAKYEAGSRHGNKDLVYLFLIVGFLILLLACANYINLATAMAINRFKEMGIKKTLGAGELLLALQLVGESIVTCWISLLFGLILLECVSPLINSLIGSNLSSHHIITSPMYGLLLLAGGTLLGILTGISPAIYLAKTNTINALKNTVSKGKGAITLRATMIVFQFSIAITLIITAIGVYSQVNYMLKKDLGFNPENVCYLSGNRGLTGDKRKLLKEKLQASPAITSVASATQVPGKITWQEGFTVKHDQKQYTFLSAEPELLELLQIPIKAGESFSVQQYGKQDSCIIINQSAKAMLGVETGDLFRDDDGQTYKIIGEVDNFNFSSLQDNVPPLIIYSRTNYLNHMLIRFEQGKTAEGLTYAKHAWDEIVPDYPFSPTFLSSSLKELYDGEEKLGSLVLFFTALALVIATMGLYGLSAFLVSKRKREIGIRKVMGATESQIRKRISYDFLKWVLMANLIAWPIAYILIDKWLERFAYHISISPLFFIIGTLVSATAALATVYWQISQAVRVNPAQTLKHE